jgi:hypothetical protein
MLELSAILPTADTRIENLPRCVDNMPTDRLYVVTYDANKVDQARGRDGFETPIELRIYWPRNPRSGMERVRAALWVRTSEDLPNQQRHYFSGAGSAGGCGYCKASGAADSAISAAGIKLSTDIHGAGESMIVEALKAIARAAGYDTFTVVGRA